MVRVDSETLKKNRRYNPAGEIYDENGNFQDFYYNQVDNYNKIIFNFTGIKFIIINYHPLWVSIILMGEAITNLMTNGMMKIIYLG